MQRLDAHALSRVRLRILLLQARGNRVQLAFCLRNGNSRLKARDNTYARVAAPQSESFRRKPYRDENIRNGPKLEIRRGHADNGEALIVERDCLAHDAFIVPEPA